MKITKQRLEGIIKEELKSLSELGNLSTEPRHATADRTPEQRLIDKLLQRAAVDGMSPVDAAAKLGLGDDKEVIAYIGTLQGDPMLDKPGGMREEGKKASKSVGDPPYRERGSTESQAQQMAAGAALSARRGESPVGKLKGASKDLYSGEISTKDLRNLAKLGQKVKGHKSKEPKHRKSLPGHATPAKD